ncbi:MAG: hypothetical protein ACYCVE_01785 [Gemmatimonadaceae bacterium]
MLLLAAQPLAAQGQPPDKVDAKACEKAAKIVARGHPAKKESSALLTLNACGAVGSSALASGLLSYANDTDPAVLDAFMGQVDNWRDSTLMAAATQLATNPAASVAARVFAVRHLLILVHPYLRYGYAGLVAGADTTVDADGTIVTTIGCAASLSSDAGDRVGTPLPVDYADQIRSTLSGLIASSATPDSVRRAARCGS